MESYRITIAGLERDLPICRVNDELDIAALVIFGDVELSVACARELVKRLPPHDYLITAEAKGIPLVHEMAKALGVNKYLLARKSPKVYMQDPFSVEVKSITTDRVQTLYIDGADAALMKGKRIAVVDDVISTGESIKAVEELVRRSGGEVVGRFCILAEGDAHLRDDISYLEYLPVFPREKKQ